MIKLVPILSNVISEGRFKMDPEVYLHLTTLAEKLWSMRDQKFTKKTLVDVIPFKTSDGVDGQVKIVINPRLPHIGNMETRPKESRDPMDFVMELQPKEYVSPKNLFLTMYHEMLHATDPSQSTRLSQKYMSTYNEKLDTHYWGHPIEFRAITNEFLEGLELELLRRLHAIRKPDNKKFLLKSIKNIINYFAKGEKLSKLSLDIIERINDEHVLDNRISQMVADMPTEFPGVSEFKSEKEDEPYYLGYVEQIKKYNPRIWPRFLKMIYESLKNIEEQIKEKGV